MKYGKCDERLRSVIVEEDDRGLRHISLILTVSGPKAECAEGLVASGISVQDGDGDTLIATVSVEDIDWLIAEDWVVRLHGDGTPASAC